MALGSRVAGTSQQQVLQNINRILNSQEEQIIIDLCEAYGLTKRNYRQGGQLREAEVLTVPKAMVDSNPLLKELYDLKIKGRVSTRVRSRIILPQAESVLSFARLDDDDFKNEDGKMERDSYVAFEFHEASVEIPKAKLEAMKKRHIVIHQEADSTVEIDE